MKFKYLFILFILIFLLTDCKKEKSPQSDNSIEGFYNQNGLSFIAKITTDSNTLTPFFIDKVRDQNSYKIIYKENENGIDIYKSICLVNGLKKVLNVPTESKYYDWSNPYLSFDGSLVVNAEYNYFIEQSDNQFSTLDRNYQENHELLKFNNLNIDNRFVFDNSEVINYQYGNEYKYLNLNYTSDKSLNFTNNKILGDKTWNYNLVELDSKNLLYAFTKEDSLFISKIDLNFNVSIIAKKRIEKGCNTRANGCDNTVKVGQSIKIVKSGITPYIFMGVSNKFYVDYQLYQLKDNEILEIDSNLKRTSLFAFNNELYSNTKNKLECFKNNQFTEVSFSNLINVLGIYVSEQGIFLAVRPKSNLNKNYFDIVSYNP